LAKNDITLALAWSGDAAAARRQNKSIRFNLPARMKLVKVECMAVTAEARHQATAEFFLNYLLLPQVSAELTNYSLYANTNEASRRHIHRDILNGPAYLQAAVTARTYLRYLGEADAEFDRAWASVKANAPDIHNKVPLRKSRAENGDDAILAERQPNDNTSKAAATQRKNKGP
jgi:spermidine/putrescine-binding protein